MGFGRKGGLCFIELDLQFIDALARPVLALAQFPDDVKSPDKNRHRGQREEAHQGVNIGDWEGRRMGAATLQKCETDNRDMTHKRVHCAVAFPHFFSGHLRDAGPNQAASLPSGDIDSKIASRNYFMGGAAGL
jgi:hypothetical protein